MSDLDPQEVFIGRQPILDRNQQTFAYDLLFRSNGVGGENFANFVDGTQASATVAANAFTEFSVADALGPYQGFIKVDREFLFSDLIDALPPQSVILELLETVEPSPEVLQRCAKLQSAGYILAVKGNPKTLTQYRALLALADIIKVDISRITPEALSALINQLNPLGKELLAEKVETSEQMQRCHDLGFDFFQGYHFAHPTVISGKRLHSPQLALLRLLTLLIQDADTAEIEKQLKQEPVLTVNLLRLTNSASSGLSTRITSLRHAISVLGRQQLMRWLQLLLYTGGASNASTNNPLLQLAATRGRMMELLAEGLHTENRKDRDFVDQAFMTGILSLMPVLLGISIAEVLAQLPLADRVQLALTEHGGALGRLLALVETTEHDAPVTDQALQGLDGIDIRFLNSCVTQALSWANNLDREQS
jgi:EAL and modified HD-GYP domain-containing signal transduction protein